MVRELRGVEESEKRLKALLYRDLGEELSKLNKTRVNTIWGPYEILYENPDDVSLVLDIINDASTSIYKASAHKKLNFIEVTSRAEVDKLEHLYSEFRGYTERVTRIPSQ